ncbi:MAG: cephalosporin hydroxylase family protein [Gemmatimonadota bacterium]
MAASPQVREAAQTFVEATLPYRYSYNFSWMGRPVIQFPQDLLAMQEIIWEVKPDLILETGIARGGSLVFYASMLALLGEGGLAVGIDIDLRGHNREAIEKHPMFPQIRLVQGSSTAPEVMEQVRELARHRQRILVVLDSNHTHDHVLEELRLYSPLVTPGSYLVVFDTVVEHLPEEASADRPWGPGNNPATAVKTFLEENSRFTVDTSVDDKLLISVAGGGFLKCVG